MRAATALARVVDPVDDTAVTQLGQGVVDGDSREQLEAFAAQARAGTPPRIRCVLDDGSHASVHQQLTMGVFFPLLEPGGVYILEDLHYQCFHREEGDANQGYELEEDTKTVDVLQANPDARLADSFSNNLAQNLLVPTSLTRCACWLVHRSTWTTASSCRCSSRRAGRGGRPTT